MLSTAFLNDSDHQASPAYAPQMPCGRRGQDLVDQLLHEETGRDRDNVDALLDLKFALIQGADAREALEVFCRLRTRLEKRHYLACYRLRRWLETRIEAVVSPGRGYAVHTCPVKLTERNPAAITATVRRSAEENGVLAPGTPARIDFAFRDTKAPVLQ